MARTFYQNSTINPATMNFNFAHIYSTRRDMRDKALIDGVYPGRYVLVEYDKAYEPVTRDANGNFQFNDSFSYKLAYAGNYDGNAPLDVYTVNYNGTTYTAGTGQTFLTSVKNDMNYVIVYKPDIQTGSEEQADGQTYDVVTGIKERVIVNNIFQ